nr:protein ANTAGONIST OF LIKE HETEROCHROMATIN PROTEIN 1-like [Onthophagus taurus]
MRLSDPESFFNFYRMSPSLFDKLLGYIYNDIKKEDVHNAIKPSERLALTLRYLATGDSMVSLTYLFRIGKSTVPYIIMEVCTAIWKRLSNMVIKPLTKDNFREIAKDFEEKWNFPHCIGALDGKHVLIQAFPNSGSENFNYKGTHSLVLLALCDANYNFTVVDIGASGRQSDGGILKNSKFGSALATNMLPIPPKEVLSGCTTPMPYVIVADEAFPLTNYLMRAYPGKRGPLEHKKENFNFRLSRARRVIENCFGIMSARFRIYRKPILCNRAGVISIIQATVCLHNYLNKYCSRNISGRNNRVNAYKEITRTGSNTYSRSAENIRNEFAEYFLKYPIEHVE